MGFFDRIRSAFGAVGAVASPRADPSGPLRLALGDGVGYYAEKWLVAGIRVLESPEGSEHHYCLKDRSGSRAVLVAVRASDGPILSLERLVDGPVAADGDVIDGVADEPFRLSRHWQARLHATGDAGCASSGRVALREFLDSAGERRIVAEDHGGRREVRVGEPAFEGEFTFLRAADAAQGAAPDALAEEAEETDSGPATRGSPRAAAAALMGLPAEGSAPSAPSSAFPVAEVPAAEEREPGYEDERWDDEADEPEDRSGADSMLAREGSEDDEWLAAVRWLRESAQS